jgi:hypothetical protein
VGTFVEIQKGASVGRRCKISSHTFICEGVSIEDEVFVGHGVTFINDKLPRATNGDGALQSETDWKCVPTRVKKGASIGSPRCFVVLRLGSGRWSGCVRLRMCCWSGGGGELARVLRMKSEWSVGEAWGRHRREPG